MCVSYIYIGVDAATELSKSVKRDQLRKVTETRYRGKRDLLILAYLSKESDERGVVKRDLTYR
jgi:hypothetical protein